MCRGKIRVGIGGREGKLREGFFEEGMGLPDPPPSEIIHSANYPFFDLEFSCFNFLVGFIKVVDGYKDRVCQVSTNHSEGLMFFPHSALNNVVSLAVIADGEGNERSDIWVGGEVGALGGPCEGLSLVGNS